MTFAVGALAALLLIELLALVLVTRMLINDNAKAQAQWATERRELLTRIQRPEHIPSGPVQQFVFPEREPDEWAKVGEIDIGDKYGLTDDG